MTLPITLATVWAVPLLTALVLELFPIVPQNDALSTCTKFKDRRTGAAWFPCGCQLEQYRLTQWDTVVIILSGSICNKPSASRDPETYTQSFLAGHVERC